LSVEVEGADVENVTNFNSKNSRLQSPIFEAFNLLIQESYDVGHVEHDV
jgi:hypothetical protein